MAKFSYSFPPFFASFSTIEDDATKSTLTQIVRTLESMKREVAKSINSLYNGDLPVALPSHTVAALPSASTYTNHMIYVSDESGGAVPAFSDGTNWRRVTDRAIVS